MPSFKRVLFTGIFLAIIGWAGLIMLIQLTTPTLGPRWLFFFFLFLAISGIALPVVSFLNIRFPSTPPIETPGILRQSSWFGIYACVLSWLQLGRVLTSFLSIAIAIGLILIEIFIRLRERSRWHPGDVENA
ncbi:MAG: hypothetical protein ABFD14_04025 [Anaerolineaceae bacterium]